MKQDSRIFVGGDTHGKQDIKYMNTWYSKNHENISQEDIFIQLGDWGAIWFDKHNIHKYKKDLELQVKWSKKKFTTLVVPGNHENYEIIDRLPSKEVFGGKVKVLSPTNIYNRERIHKDIYLLQRGEIYTINGLKILALGGAMSHDKSTRTVGVDWWERELWSFEEESNCISNLDKVDWKVDFVVAHTCPEEVSRMILTRNGKEFYSIDPTSKFFSHLISEGLRFKEWHFGHWHEDGVYSMNIGEEYLTFKCHYTKIEEITW